MNQAMYGLIGRSLQHSFSQKYFTQKILNEGLTHCVYQNFEIENIELLTQIIQRNENLIGLNVTIPYKEAVIPLLHDIDETAASIGAVNCIRVIRNQNSIQLKGYNTDAFGFKTSIKPFLTSQHHRALILGTGGASKAVHHVLKQIGIDCFFVSRYKNTKKEIANCLDYTELNQYVMDAFKLIVNTTPLGMYPHSNTFPEIPYQYISTEHLLFDLVYNPQETLFLEQGKAQGAKVVNGLSMLHLQAEEAWRIWNTPY
jgi:shikimate dehydrogenase